MPNYHIKVRKGRKETFHPADGLTITAIPSEGYYAEHPEEVGVPKGQRVKFELSNPLPGTNKLVVDKEIMIPRDGQVAYVLNEKGDTVDTYPKKRDRQQIRNLKEDKGNG